MLLKIVSSIRCLHVARQGLALRGDGDEKDGNFFQLLRMKGEDDPTLLEWLKRKSYCTSTFPLKFQNELPKVMSRHILLQVASCLQQSPFPTIMLDETTDISNNEQATAVMQWVSESLEVHEEFIGLYHVPSISADTLTAVIKDTLA